MMSARTRPLLNVVLAAALVLLVGGALTLMAANKARRDANAISEGRFHRSTQHLLARIAEQLRLPRYTLASLYSVAQTLGHAPTNDQLRDAVLESNLSHEDVGVDAFSFIEPVRADQLAGFIARAQAVYGDQFVLKTVGHPDELYVIRTIEPLEPNRAALGYDIGSEPNRRAALEQTLRTHQLALTAPIYLLRGKGVTPATAYLCAVYLRQRPRDHVADATPPALIGLVSVAVEYSTLLAPLDVSDSLLSFELADVTGSTPVEVYQTAQPFWRGSAGPARFHTQAELALGGRRFRVRMASAPSFDRVAAAMQSRGVAWLGGIITVLGAIVTWLLLGGRQRALALAQAMTVELDQLAMVGKLTTDAVLIIDPQGHLRWANPAFEQLTGLPLAQVKGSSALALPGFAEGDHPADAVIARVLASGTPFYGEATLRDHAGKLIWTTMEAQPFSDRRGRAAGFVVIQANVTERRATDAALHESRAFLDQTGQVAGVGGWQLDLQTQALVWSAQTRRIHEVPDDYVPQLDQALMFYPPGAREKMQAAISASIASGKGWDLELPFVSYRKRHLWVRAMGVVEFDGAQATRLIGAFQDISQRKFAEIALEENRELLRVTLNSIGDAVVTTDAFGLVTWLNPIAEAITGWTAAAAKGKHIAEVLSLVSDETRHRVPNPVVMALKQNKIVGLALNTVLITRDGTEYGIEDSAAPIRNAFGRVIGVVMVFRDVTAARLLTREMVHQARHDSLTGLPNRLEFETRLSRFLLRSERSSESGAMMFIDLDHFKIVNDTCGHFAGDQLLCQLSALIKSCVRSHDTVARLGGDEFGLLLENCSAQNAERIAQKICDAADQFRFVANPEQAFRVGTSIGVVPIEVPWRDPDDVMRAADESCYMAKEGGRNRFHTWQAQDQAMHNRIGESLWGARIEKALDERGFELYAQRIEAISPAAGAPAQGLHCEVLLRLRDADGKLVAPGTFLPVAERYQLSSRVDRWVVQEVFDRLSDMEGSAALPSLLAINLSGQSISDRSFHEFIMRLLDLALFDVRVLCFEITETAAVTNLAEATVFLDAMRRRGIRIALDDFGAGMSSFGYLKNFNVDFLKIDGQFVRDLASNPLDLVSVRSFCDVARVLGIQTIAEYVEREEQRVILQQLGVDFVQGFLLHQPEPLANLFLVAATS